MRKLKKTFLLILVSVFGWSFLATSLYVIGIIGFTLLFEGNQMGHAPIECALHCVSDLEIPDPETADVFQIDPGFIADTPTRASSADQEPSIAPTFRLTSLAGDEQFLVHIRSQVLIL